MDKEQAQKTSISSIGSALVSGSTKTGTGEVVSFRIGSGPVSGAIPTYGMRQRVSNGKQEVF